MPDDNLLVITSPYGHMFRLIKCRHYSSCGAHFEIRLRDCDASGLCLTLDEVRSVIRTLNVVVVEGLKTVDECAAELNALEEAVEAVKAKLHLIENNHE